VEISYLRFYTTSDTISYNGGVYSWRVQQEKARAALTPGRPAYAWDKSLAHDSSVRVVRKRTTVVQWVLFIN
jgi:hypothetical protein